MNTTMKYSLFTILLCCICLSDIQAQFPVADFWGRTLSRTTSVVQQASEVINNIAQPLVNAFGEAQDFFKKAETIVNGTIRNMRMVEEIVQLEIDIRNSVEDIIEILKFKLK